MQSEQTDGKYKISLYSQHIFFRHKGSSTTFYSNQTYLSLPHQNSNTFSPPSWQEFVPYKLDIVSPFGRMTRQLLFPSWYSMTLSSPRPGNGYCIYPPWFKHSRPYGVIHTSDNCGNMKYIFRNVSNHCIQLNRCWYSQSLHPPKQFPPVPTSSLSYPTPQIVRPVNSSLKARNVSGLLSMTMTSWFFSAKYSDTRTPNFPHPITNAFHCFQLLFARHTQ